MNLSELIKQCKAHFYSLTRGVFGEWKARASVDGEIIESDGEGNTPEQAVENLIVKLKEKNII